jgi:regulator of protease activity HflC (stomatin/prohibitin superfamily)
MLDRQTENWGIKVNAVEIKDVEIPQLMQRAIAKQAEAERERRAKVVSAEGEFQAAEKLAQAAAVIATQPGAMQLRQLQTMVEVSAEKNSTLIFPIPIELMTGLKEAFASVAQHYESSDEKSDE